MKPVIGLVKCVSVYVMSKENMIYHFRLVCQWCGYSNHDDVPIPSEKNKALIWCKHCNKVILEFHEAEK